MLFNVSICIAGILMGLAISISLIYVARFKVYMDTKKKSGDVKLKLVDILWKVLLPVLFGFIALIMPTKILCLFEADASVVKELSSFYLYSFVFSFFIFIFLLIKCGKIKVKNKFE